MSGTMRAVVKPSRAPGAELTTVPIPEVGPGEVLVKVKATAICGTDLHIYRWDPWAEERLRPPLIFGHEFCGDVAEVGAGVTSVKVGDFVSAETHVTCGTCRQCRTGNAHICQNLKILGVDTDGCFAEYVKIPAINAWKVDPSVPVEVAAIHDPLGNAVHSAMSVNMLGKNVAVVGCGPIGLVCVAIAKMAGASRVIAVEVNEYRAGLAGKLGADVVVNPARESLKDALLVQSDGIGVDIVLEMSGHPDAIRQSFAGLAQGGTVVMLGIPPKPMELDFANAVVFREAKVLGITGRLVWQTWFETAALLRGGLDVRPVITHTFRLDEFEKAMQLALSGNAGKIVLYP